MAPLSIRPMVDAATPDASASSRCDIPASVRSAFTMHLMDRVAAQELPRSATPAPQERAPQQERTHLPRLARRHAV